jgi:hypothetical protein
MNFISLSFGNALQHTPRRISFGPEGNNPGGEWAFPQIDEAWLRDAVLVRIEAVPVAEFVKPMDVHSFRFDGRYALSGQSRFQAVTPDLDTLAKITLPHEATRADVQKYIAAILVASQGATGSIGDHDPQVAMLEQVGAENVDLLVAAARDTHNFYLNRSINHLAQPDQKAMIIADLPSNVDLVRTIVDHGWQVDARDVLIAGLDANKGDPNVPRAAGQPFSYISTEWIQAVAGFQDPATYPALRDYFVNHSDSRVYQVIEKLPGFDAAGALKEAWAKAQSSRDTWRLGNLLPLAAGNGEPEVPAVLVKIMSGRGDPFPYPRQIARRITHQYTPAVGKTDEELAAWLKVNAGNLVFDPASKKYVLGAAPAPPPTKVSPTSPASPATAPVPPSSAPVTNSPPAAPPK